ncbi:hypothetical protein PM082_015347 [Marasmius tenuissimus]|nr:hypothetical protein PM082_015347 [Marasmius tenuissimus]
MVPVNVLTDLDDPTGVLDATTSILTSTIGDTTDAVGDFTGTPILTDTLGSLVTEPTDAGGLVTTASGGPSTVSIVLSSLMSDVAGIVGEIASGTVPIITFEPVIAGATRTVQSVADLGTATDTLNSVVASATSGVGGDIGGATPVIILATAIVNIPGTADSAAGAMVGSLQSATGESSDLSAVTMHQ